MGIGKMKNSRFTFRKGPLIIYGDDDSNLKRTSRNLGGVEICHVSRINLLQLAPGGHLGRIINSDQVQSKLRDQRTSVRAHDKTKKNPLKNRVMMQKLSPYSKTARELEAKATEARVAARKAALAKKHSKAGRAEKAKRTARFNMLHENLEESFRDAQKVIEDEIKAGLLDQSSEEEEEDDE